jgi:hypothetical protein
MVHLDFVNSVLGYRQAQIRFTLMTIGNESLITRARNTILSEFMVRNEFSHLLFLDADVKLPANGLRRMLASDRDVVGAPVALKSSVANGARNFNIGRLLGEDGSLYQVEHIGTAALLLTRKRRRPHLFAWLSCPRRGYASQRSLRRVPHRRGRR